MLRKCLGISPEQFRATISPDQRLELIVHWFAGDEATIPYEEWGLTRPSWLART